MVERTPPPEDLPPDLREAIDQAQADPDWVAPLPKEDLRPRAVRLYRLLEQLLFRGFLSSEWSAAGGRVRIRLKTLNLREIELARECAPAFLTDWERSSPERLAAALQREAAERAQLAFSIYRVEGAGFLGGGSQTREEAALALRPLLWTMRAPEIRAALRSALTLAHLNSLVSRTVLPYAYGQDSRRRWAALSGGVLLCSEVVTGISGTSGLGLNSAQEAWTWINRLTDQYEAQQSDYDLAKFQAGVHAGKEVRKLDKRERQATRDRQRKEQLIWAMADMDAWDPESSGAENILVEDSSKDLLQQMERAVRGDRDYHDSVIQAHEDRIRQNLLARAAEREAYLASLHEARLAQEGLEDLDPDLLAREGGSLLVVVPQEESDRRAAELAAARWERASAEPPRDGRSLNRDWQDLETSLAIAERHHLLGPGPSNGGPPKPPG